MALTRKKGRKKGRKEKQTAAVRWGWNFKINPDFLTGFKISPVSLSWPEVVYLLFMSVYLWLVLQ